MFCICGPNEMVFAELGFARQFLKPMREKGALSAGCRPSPYFEYFRSFIAKQLGVHAGLFCRSLHLLPVNGRDLRIIWPHDLHAMLIRSCEKHRLFSFKYLPSLHYIRKDHCIEMSHVRGGIDVEYRRRDIVGFFRNLLGRNGAIAVAVYAA